MNKKRSTCFFFQHPSPETRRPPKTHPNRCRHLQTLLPPCQFYPNTIIIKINPLDIKLVTFLQVARDSSITVALGGHYPIRLWCRNCKSCAPWGEKYVTITQNKSNDGTISVIVTKYTLDKEERRHPRQQDSWPFPKTSPDMPCICFASTRLPRHTASIVLHHKYINNFVSIVCNRLVSHSCPFWQSDRPVSRC